VETASEYTNKIYQGILSNWNNLMAEGCMYHGVEGAKRLAREYGRGLSDFPKKEATGEIGSSYSILLVRLTNLKPPIDAKVWVKEIMKSLN